VKGCKNGDVVRGGVLEQIAPYTYTTSIRAVVVLRIRMQTVLHLHLHLTPTPGSVCHDVVNAAEDVRSPVAAAKTSKTVMLSDGEAGELGREPCTKGIVTWNRMKVREPNTVISREARVEVSKNEGGMRVAVGEGTREEGLLLGYCSCGLDV
jgi:hypothetical protein